MKNESNHSRGRRGTCSRVFLRRHSRWPSKIHAHNTFSVGCWLDDSIATDSTLASMGVRFGSDENSQSNVSDDDLTFPEVGQNDGNIYLRIPSRTIAKWIVVSNNELWFGNVAPSPCAPTSANASACIHHEKRCSVTCFATLDISFTSCAAPRALHRNEKKKKKRPTNNTKYFILSSLAASSTFPSYDCYLLSKSKCLHRNIIKN